jgi:hypothetical protein
VDKDCQTKSTSGPCPRTNPVPGVGPGSYARTVMPPRACLVSRIQRAGGENDAEFRRRIGAHRRGSWPRIAMWINLRVCQP